MEAEIRLEELRRLCDFEAGVVGVERALEHALAGPSALVRFVGRYSSWNGWFGSGVAALAGKIGRSRALFVDAAEPVAALADRSVLVASYFFDAARDEFDDRDTPHRDTHRCLAQALLKGLLGLLAREQPELADAAFVNQLLLPPLWLSALSSRVAQGYGAIGADDAAAIFRAIGYHLGSEILADREFSLIDASLRRERAELVAALEQTTVRVADETHRAYTWLRIHSGHGGAAEAQHFAWATRGAKLALELVPEPARRPLKHQLELGFADFYRDHQEFFANISES